MKKVKSAMSNLAIRDFIAGGENLVIDLTGNANFPALPYTVAQMTTGLNELNALQDQVDQGLVGASVQRDSKRKDVQNMITANVGYINAVAKGDEARLATTGLPFAKTPASQPMPGAIAKVTAVNSGELGSVLFTNSHSANRVNYVRQMTTNASTGPWINLETNPSNRIVVTGLTSNTTYWFRSAGVNKAGQGPWSATAKVTVAA